MAIPSYSGANNKNGMQHNMSSSNLVAMLQGPCNTTPPRMGQLQVAAPGLLVGRLEDAVTTTATGQKRPFSYDGPTVEDGPGELDGDEGGDELSPGGSHLEKKRRLTFDQVRSLERNFEMENKLEPERKMQLAKELGLRPRQVAVWFQNRRARWKTKQLERDYETLAADYERLKEDYDRVMGEKKLLKAEVQRLSGVSPASTDDVKLEPAAANPCEYESRQCHNARSSPTVDVSLANLNKDEAVSGSSDLLDADSPRTTDSSSSDVHREDVEYQIHGLSTPDSLSSFLGADPGTLQVPLDAATTVAPPTSSDGDGCFHELVDQSCNYLLLQLDDQSSLPWWDWP